MKHHPWLITGCAVCVVASVSYFVVARDAWHSRPEEGVEVHPTSLVIEPAPDESSSRVASFSILNRESTRVRIESVRSSCGCTVAGPLSTTVLEPGQKVIVPLTISSSDAEKKARVFIGTSSKKNPDLVVELRIVGRRRSLPYAESLPPEIQVVGTSPGEWVEHQLEFTTIEAKNKSPWLESMVSGDGIEILEWSSSIAASLGIESVRRKYRGCLLVQIPDHPNGQLPRRLDFRASPTDTTVISSTLVFATLRPLIRAVPPELAIHIGPDQKPVQREILLVGDRSWVPPTELSISNAVQLRFRSASAETPIKHASIQIDPTRVPADQTRIDINIPTSISAQPTVSIRMTVVRDNDRQADK